MRKTIFLFFLQFCIFSSKDDFLLLKQQISNLVIAKLFYLSLCCDSTVWLLNLLRNQKNSLIRLLWCSYMILLYKRESHNMTVLFYGCLRWCFTYCKSLIYRIRIYPKSIREYKPYWNVYTYCLGDHVCESYKLYDITKWSLKNVIHIQISLNRVNNI